MTTIVVSWASLVLGALLSVVVFRLQRRILSREAQTNIKATFEGALQSLHADLNLDLARMTQKLDVLTSSESRRHEQGEAAIFQLFSATYQAMTRTSFDLLGSWDRDELTAVNERMKGAIDTILMSAATISIIYGANMPIATAATNLMEKSIDWLAKMLKLGSELKVARANYDFARVKLQSALHKDKSTATEAVVEAEECLARFTALHRGIEHKLDPEMASAFAGFVRAAQNLLSVAWPLPRIV